MKYKILVDHNPFNPRDEENMGTIALVSNRYLSEDYIMSYDDINNILSNKKDYISLPLFAYIHGNIALNTVGFSCPWDSGQIGCIFVNKSEIRDSFRVKRVGPKLHDKILSYLSDEVRIYHNYLNNEVYGYIIYDDDNQEIDSCWGYYDRSQAEYEAQNYIESLYKKTA
jgi:hypothetical protein